jgi:hypothetical protein
MAQEGKEVQPDPSFGKTMLMSALMGEEIPKIDCSQAPVELKQGDRLIVSSDGLDTLDAQKIRDCLAIRGKAKECAEALLKAVEDVGAPRQDNTTVVVIEALTRVPANAPEAVEERPDSDFQGHNLSTEPSAREVISARDPRRSSRPRWLRAALPVLLALGGGFWWMGSRYGTEPGTTPLPAPEPAEAKAPAAISSRATSSRRSKSEPQALPSPPRVVRFADSLSGGGKAPEMVWIPAGTFTMGSPRCG